MLKVLLSGIGKAGSEVAKYMLAQNDISVVAAICSPKSGKRGKDLGEVIGIRDTGIRIEPSDTLEQVIFRTRPDVAIDFSTPSSAISNARVFTEMNVGVVIGTTGFSATELKQIEKMAQKGRAGVVVAPNISLGINLVMLLCNISARILCGYDFQINEIHHKHKKDAPSGTAIKIAAEIEDGLRCSGALQRSSGVPISSVRAGGVVGIHKVMIVGEHDKIEITHESFSRNVFASGALQAARFISDKTGYYEMGDVLNLKKIVADYLTQDKDYGVGVN